MKKSHERCIPKKVRKETPMINMTKLTPSPNDEALVLIHALLGLRNRILNICQSASTITGSTTQDNVFRWMISSQDVRIRQCHHTSHLKNALDAFQTHILTSRSPRSQV